MIINKNAIESWGKTDKDEKIQVGKEKSEKAKENIEQDLRCKEASFVANKKWLSLPKEARYALERNVWCGNGCDAVQIENYIHHK